MTDQAERSYVGIKGCGCIAAMLRGDTLPATVELQLKRWRERGLRIETRSTESLGEQMHKRCPHGGNVHVHD